jgi:hypothetical protein
MAIDVKEPAVRASWQPKEENDPLYRYPKPYPVGRAVGVTIPAWHDTSRFSIIWGTLVAQKGWDDVPDEYKGAGRPARSLARRSRARRGHPGLEDRGRIRERQERQIGLRPLVHFPELHLFRAITGMAIADQGYQSEEPLGKNDWESGSAPTSSRSRIRRRARPLREANRPSVGFSRASRRSGAPARRVRFHSLRSVAPSFR